MHHNGLSLSARGGYPSPFSYVSTPTDPPGQSVEGPARCSPVCVLRRCSPPPHSRSCRPRDRPASCFPRPCEFRAASALPLPPDSSIPIRQAHKPRRKEDAANRLLLLSIRDSASSSRRCRWSFSGALKDAGMVPALGEMGPARQKPNSQS
ncbi:hypothetical protein VTI74DRAFT_6809 [Chaetomium olivicolor]